MIDETEAEKREILEADKREILDWLNEDDTPSVTPSRQLDMSSLSSFESLGLTTPKSEDRTSLFSPPPTKSSKQFSTHEESDEERETADEIDQSTRPVTSRNDEIEEEEEEGDDDDELSYRQPEDQEDTTDPRKSPIAPGLRETDITVNKEENAVLPPPAPESVVHSKKEEGTAAAAAAAKNERRSVFLLSESKRNNWELTSAFTKSLTESAAKASAAASSANERILTTVAKTQTKMSFSLLGRKTNTKNEKTETENGQLAPEASSSSPHASVTPKTEEDEVRGVFSIGDEDEEEEEEERTEKEDVAKEETASTQKNEPPKNKALRHQPSPIVDPTALALAQHRIAGLQKGQEIIFDSKNLPDTVLFSCIKLKPVSKALGFNLGPLGEKKLVRCIGVNRERVLVFDTRGKPVKFGVTALVKSNHHLTELVKLTFPRAREPDVIAMHIRAGISPDAPADQVALKANTYKVPRAPALIKQLQDRLARFR